jgi:hypothetical protein
MPISAKRNPGFNASAAARLCERNPLSIGNMPSAPALPPGVAWHLAGNRAPYGRTRREYFVPFANLTADLGIIAIWRADHLLTTTGLRRCNKLAQKGQKSHAPAT